MLIKHFFTANTIYIVRPTTILRDSTSNESIAASDLKIRSETTSQNVQCHFEKVLLGEVFKEQEQEELKEAVGEFLKERMPLKHSLTPAIQRCTTDVFENLTLLKNGIRNEADLRFALESQVEREYNHQNGSTIGVESPVEWEYNNQNGSRMGVESPVEWE